MIGARESMGARGGDRPVERDEAVAFGADGNLVGVLSPARARANDARDDAAAARDRPAVVLLNAGVIHRVGPHRLHVALARRLAGRGYPSFRIDLSGIGDSRPIESGLTFRASAVADARAAMDALHALTGAERFVLFGLCSGADNAQATALADDRVAGIVLVDPHMYPTLRARGRKLGARVRELGTAPRVAAWAAHVGVRAGRAGARLAWSRLERLRASRGAGADAAGAGPAADDGANNGRVAPARAVFGAELEALLARGAEILAIFSAGSADRYNHPDQLFEVFPALRGRVATRYFPEANHTFTELAAQEDLIGAVTDWIERITRRGSASRA